MSSTKLNRKRYEPDLDRLPEQMYYADNGCEVAMSCLNCPLPQCKFDNPGWYRSYRRQVRDEEILWSFHYEGLTAFELASRFGLSPRTIQRALNRAVKESFAVAA